MPCPFLQEARVGQCACSSGAKLIPRTADGASAERCSSPLHRECPVFRERHGGADDAERCPWLLEPLTQFCSAAPVVKYIPYSESLLSRCGNDSYRYCELYLTLANAGTRAGDRWAGDIRIPSHLRYTANHMWFDPGTGARWHAGIDGLLAKLLGPVERIRFAPGAMGQPAAFLTMAGTEIEIGFPYALPRTATHDHLRSRPELLKSDPYGQGWLFEGETATVHGLLDAAGAAEWMRGEVDRVSEFLGLQPASEGPATCCDGGTLAEGALAHLNPERIRVLCDEFFPPYPKWEREA